MASEEAPTLGETLLGLMERGVGGITSARQLAGRLASLKGTSAEGERRSISRHIRLGNAEEETIAWYAKAFGVDRDLLPPAATRPRRAVSAAEFEELRSQVEVLQEMVDRLGPLLRDLDPSEAETT